MNRKISYYKSMLSKTQYVLYVKQISNFHLKYLNFMLSFFEDRKIIIPQHIVKVCYLYFNENVLHPQKKYIQINKLLFNYVESL